MKDCDVVLFIFGESYASLKGTKGTLLRRPTAVCPPVQALCLTPYAYYYVVLFLEIFDWLSDVVFIGIDMTDSRMKAGQYMPVRFTGARSGAGQLR